MMTSIRWFAVTATTKAAEAIEMLRKNKDSYDIVITDVMRSDMDVFKLLEIIGLEMDIPVISDEPTSIFSIRFVFSSSLKLVIGIMQFN
mgnify:FL=1